MRRRRQIDASVPQAFEIQFADRIRRLYDSLVESKLVPLRQRLAKQLGTLVETTAAKKGAK